VGGLCRPVSEFGTGESVVSKSDSGDVVLAAHQGAVLLLTTTAFGVRVVVCTIAIMIRMFPFGFQPLNVGVEVS
jgi:hypothetical protein